MAGFDKDAYDRKYKQDKFDHFSFYAPKGTREKVDKKAQEQGMKLSEYLRNLIEKDTR